MSINQISLVLLVTLSRVQAAPFNEICQNDACRQAAKRIDRSLNRQMDPCDDFYEFACGGWIREHPVPKTKPSYSTAIETNDQMLDEIRYYLESNNSSESNSKIVQLTRFIYNQCIRLPSTNQSDENLISKLFSVTSTTNYNLSGQWWDLYMDVIRSGLTTKPGLFDLEVIQNPKNQSEYLISLDTVEYPVDEQILMNKDYQNSSLVYSYRKFLQNISSLIPIFPKGEQIIDELLQLEHKLVSFEMPISHRRDPSNVINILTIEEFQQKTHGFDWLHRIIEPILDIFKINHQATLSDRLLVTDLNYFQNLTEFLSTVPLRIVQTYFRIRALQELVPFLGEPTRQALYSFWKRNSGVRSTPERWRTCFSQIQTMFPWALSRLYVDNYFSDQAANRPKAMEIVNEVHNAFMEIIRMDPDWIEPEVKKISLQKLDHIGKNVAFPDWLLDNGKLDQYYNWLNGDEWPINEILDNYLPILTRFKWKQMQANFEKFHQNELSEFDRNYWPLEPARINAAYSPEDNSITIPAGILRPPFYHKDWPASLNYGGIGSVVGHELTHSLDDEGRHFDHEGNYRPPSSNCIETDDRTSDDEWWTQQMTFQFDQRSKCLVEQYSNIEEPITRLPLNGTNTLGENIADNGGLRQAYFALQQTTANRRQLLADLPEFTVEQLFFLANAQIWCTNVRPSSLRSKIHYDLHVPAKYRVNVPASNMNEFSKAFHCPEGSRMNPERKCVLW